MNTEPDFYNKYGENIELAEWSRLVEDDKYKRVLLTDIDHGIVVSTVWLGMNHNWLGEGPPLIFETMVFGGEYDSHMIRTSTIKEARAAHKEVVSTLRKGLPL